MPQLTRNFSIKARDFVRAGEVSIQVQGVLKAIGFPAEVIRRIAICAYESEMNVVMHGGDGELRLKVDTGSIDVEVEDYGEGIENIELALQEGYSTASPEDRERGFGAGMGLPNIKKNADSLDIHSKKGEGTCLKMSFMTGGGNDGSRGK
ncbi:MAG: anti-sigma regulatory factor [Deltaproteobacteria bacterium HGW-Deltaproteobacteria-21]|nr:MAG: anti-sigma regulatory factor [Deltaproteobacteria bacterium HGW-Deltaproteobacteria-21]